MTSSGFASPQHHSFIPPHRQHLIEPHLPRNKLQIQSLPYSSPQFQTKQVHLPGSIFPLTSAVQSIIYQNCGLCQTNSLWILAFGGHRRTTYILELISGLEFGGWLGTEKPEIVANLVVGHRHSSEQKQLTFGYSYKRRGYTREEGRVFIEESVTCPSALFSISNLWLRGRTRRRDCDRANCDRPTPQVRLNFLKHSISTQKCCGVEFNTFGLFFAICHRSTTPTLSACIYKV